MKCETAVVYTAIPRDVLLVGFTRAFLRASERAGSGHRAHALDAGDMQGGVDGKLTKLRTDRTTQLRGEILAHVDVHELNPTSGWFPRLFLVVPVVFRSVGHPRDHLKVDAAPAHAAFVLYHEVALRIVANPVLNFQSIGPHLRLVLPVCSLDRDESVDIVHPRASNAVPRTAQSNNRDTALGVRGRAAASEETPSWIRHKSDFRGAKQNVVQRNRRDILVFAAIDDDRRNIKLATFRHAMHDTKNEEHTGWTGGLKHGIEGFVFVAETLLRAAPIVHRGEMRARRVTLEAAQSAGHDDQ